MEGWRLAVLVGGACGVGALYCSTSYTPPPPIPSASWPARPDAATTSSTAIYTFAIDSLHLGDELGDTWMNHGFDLDGKVSTNRSMDGCTRVSGAPSSVQQDGTRGGFGGIDNSFGANIVPFLTGIPPGQVTDGAVPHLSKDFTDSIRAGLFTLQLRVVGLDGSAGQTNVGSSVGSFRTSTFSLDGGVPMFLPTEDWPVRRDGVAGSDGGRFEALDFFRESYVTSGIVVSGFAELTFGIVYGAPLDLRIHRALVVMTVDGDTATGTLAGVLDTEEFIAAAQSVAGHISKSFCGSAFDGIAQLFRQCSDILVDGSSSNGKSCNAISFGVGFTARRIAEPVRLADKPGAVPDPCLPYDAGPPDSGPRSTWRRAA